MPGWQMDYSAGMSRMKKAGTGKEYLWDTKN